MVSAEELMRQAAMTAEGHMARAVRCIDEQFGDGYAKAHPELVAAFMSAAVAEYRTNLWSLELAPALHRIADALDK